MTAKPMGRTQIIAEVASNHGGDLELAKQYIRAAAGHGADVVKFQSWQARHMSKDDSQYDWFLKSELSDEAHLELMAECKTRGVGFMTTCFDVGRVEFLASLGLQDIKVGSADTASYRMLKALRSRFHHVILSTGMATDEEVRTSCDILSGGAFTLMHTVSLYPTPPERAHLRRLRWLETLSRSVGYSDHLVGLDAVKQAIDYGVRYVEKHFCLSRSGPGRVMPWDMTPSDIEELRRFAEHADVLAGDTALPLDETLNSARTRFIGRFGDNQ
jgi:N,N'-diacetyllegionaminate synthase